MNFIKINSIYFIAIGLLFSLLFFSQCKPIKQPVSGQNIPLEKQEAIAQLFDNAKIIKEYTWKDYLNNNKQLANDFGELKISNGFFYDIIKPGESPITIAVLKDNLAFIKPGKEIKAYTGKYIDLSKVDIINIEKAFILLPLSFICSNDICVNLYGTTKSECFDCSGTQDIFVREISERLY